MFNPFLYLFFASLNLPFMIMYGSEVLLNWFSCGFCLGCALAAYFRKK